MAMAVFGLAVVLGPAFGPTLGGYIVDNYAWEWIFYINVPVGLLALFMVQRFVYEPEDIRKANIERAAEQRKHMDWAGIALLSLGLAALQYTLEEGGRNDWYESSLITTTTLVALFVLAAFAIRELTAPVPAVDISLFKDRVFLSGTLIGAVMFAMLLSITFLLPVFMQELLGFTAMQSGIALMPRSLMMMVAMPIVGRLYNKVSPRIFVGFGIVLFSITAYFMSQYTLETSQAQIIGVLLVQGVAFACLFIPLTTVALSTIPRPKLADATGLNSLLRQIGGSTGLAIFASLIPRFTTQANAALATHVTDARIEVTQRLALMTRAMITRGFDETSAAAGARRALGLLVHRQAAVLAFERLFMVAGITFLFVLPLLFYLRSPRHGVKPAETPHIEM